MIVFLLFLIVCELAALIIMARSGKLTGPSGEAGPQGAEGPEGLPGVTLPAEAAAPLPPAPVSSPALVADNGIWELLEWHHQHWQHKAWVREGSPAYEAGRKRGHALRRGGELIEGIE